MPEYIEQFIDKGLKLILEGDGEGFVEYYNETLQKIYYKQIPLKKIATKKKYKMSVIQYINRGTDKNGKKKAKQAHMEAVMLDREIMLKAEYENAFGSSENVSYVEMNKAVGHLLPNEPDMDSYIYYVNIGTKKGHSDSAMITHADGTTTLGCKIIKNEDLENNPDILGDYNADKYVTAFNKRVSSILEGFDPKIRKMILVSNPANREHFSKSELELKNFPADDLEESLVLEDKELEFWNRTGLKPSLIWDGYKLPEPNALEEIDEYEDNIRKLNEKLKSVNDPRIVKSVNDKLEDNDLVLHKNFNIYDLYVVNKNKLTLVRSNMFAPEQSKEYDFMEIGLSKKTIEMKKQMVEKFKEEFKIPETTKLSTIENGLLMLENFIRIENEKLKDKKKKEEEEEEDEDDD
jgi:hypothetical protein